MYSLLGLQSDYRLEILFSQQILPCLQDKKVEKVQPKLYPGNKGEVKFSFHKRVELFNKLELEMPFE